MRRTERQGRVGLMLNVRRETWNRSSVLPALKHPTISTLSNHNWVAVNTIIEESEPGKLSATEGRRAQGIVEYPAQ